jgi:hypothetical protein
MKTSLLRIPLFLFIAFALSCSSSPEKKDGSLTDESGPIPRYLELIPASTPFVFGALDPVPEPVALEQFAALDRALSASIEGLPEDAELGYMQPEERFTYEMARELSGKLDEKGLVEFGLSSSPRFVVYGIGPFPVFRMEIEDGARLTALFDRVAKTSGLQLAVQKEQDVEYRSYISDDVQVVFAVIGNEAVFTAAKIDAASIVIPYALGVKKPEASLAKDNPLDKAAQTYGLERHGVGFVNIVETAAMLTDRGSALNAAAFSVVRGEAREPVSAACQQEVADYAAAMPRIVGGLQQLTVDSVTVKVAAEFTNDIPSRLLAAQRPIPGWAVSPIQDDSTAPISIGIGAHLGAMIELARTELRESRDRAFACEELQQVPQSASEMLAMTQFIPPVVSDLTGARMSFEGIRYGDPSGASSQPAMGERTIDAWAVLRTPDPQGFFATLQTFAPTEIQGMRVSPDGEPVEVPFPPEANTPFESLKVFMSSSAIGATTNDSLLPPAQKMTAAGQDDKTPMIAVAFDLARVMSTMMGGMAPTAEEQPDSKPFLIKVSPTDKAVVTTVSVPFKALLSGSMY